MYLQTERSRIGGTEMMQVEAYSVWANSVGPCFRGYR